MPILLFPNYIASPSEACIESGISVILMRQSFKQTKLAFCLHGPFKASKNWLLSYAVDNLIRHLLKVWDIEFNCSFTIPQ